MSHLFLNLIATFNTFCLVYLESGTRFIKSLAALYQLDDKDGELLVAGGGDGDGHALDDGPRYLHLPPSLLRRHWSVRACVQI